jgi:dCMP deaminase
MVGWLEYFVNIANVVKGKSKDPSTQIGAIIIGQGKEILATGYNSFPRGINDYKEERYERPEKYYWFEHAERNAIYNAARSGMRLEGSTIILSSGLPCSDCARGIIQAGIARVICLDPSLDPLSKKPKWIESFKRSEDLLVEAGVSLIYYTPEKIKTISI